MRKGLIYSCFSHFVRKKEAVYGVLTDVWDDV